jgi:tricorn protease
MKLNSMKAKSYFPQCITFLLCLLSTTGLIAQGINGYYQEPTISGDKIIFTAESDLWSVPLTGGLAQRLTSHPGEESNPKISPDGKTLAFTGNYEGSSDLYTMPIAGGLPKRWTYGESAIATTWTPQGDLVYTTRNYSTLPQLQLVKMPHNRLL